MDELLYSLMVQAKWSYPTVWIVFHVNELGYLNLSVNGYYELIKECIT